MYPGIVLGPPNHSSDGDNISVTVPMRVNGDKYEVHHHVKMPATPQSGSEVLFPAAFLTALFAKAPLRSEGPISQLLLENVGKLQDLWCLWTDLPRIEVSAPARPTTATFTQGIASFFSGGVDSFYTIFKHRDEITHLITVWGFDVPFNNTELREKVAGPLQRAAAQLGKPLIEVRTDLRALLDRYVSWENAHGAALAGIALLLSPMFQKVFIPASSTYATLLPWGSHLLLDPLWSTNETQLMPDGYEATRFTKVALISKEPVVLQTLRVCWENPQNAYNCGRCRKCLRTMAMLRAVGALQHASTFKEPLNLRAMARACAFTEMDVEARFHYERPTRQTLEHVQRSGNDPALASALQDCLNEKYHRSLWGLWYRLASLVQGAAHRSESMLNNLRKNRFSRLP